MTLLRLFAILFDLPEILPLFIVFGNIRQKEDP
jgi:hypothetical protein